MPTRPISKKEGSPPASLWTFAPWWRSLRVVTHDEQKTGTVLVGARSCLHRTISLRYEFLKQKKENAPWQDRTADLQINVPKTDVLVETDALPKTRLFREKEC